MTSAVDGYLARLDAELWRVPPRLRARIREEVRGHLDDAIAAAMTEAAAIARFGDPAEVAQRFFEEGIGGVSRKVSRVTLPFLCLTGIISAGISTPRVSFGSIGAPDLVAIIPVIVGVQVAFVAGIVTLARVLAQRRSPRASRDAEIVRGCRVGLVAGLPSVGVVTAGAFVAVTQRDFGAFGSPVGIFVMVLIGGSWLLLLASTSRAFGARDWMCIARSGDAHVRPIGDLVDAWASVIDRAQGIAPIAPAARYVDRGARAIVRSARTNAPRACSWFDLEVHPWRAASSTAACAGLLGGVGMTLHDAVAGDISPIAGVVTGGAEALLVLLGFAVLAPVLGLRAKGS